MTKQSLVNTLRGKLIVSCQALPEEPLYDPERSIMPFMARAAKEAGAAAIRTNSVRDVVGIKRATGLPVIGLIKIHYEGYAGYITPTMLEIDQLREAGADVIALDCTQRVRGDGLKPEQFLGEIRKKHGDILLMADCAVFDDARIAAEAGADFVGTTMSGYTDNSPKSTQPDYALVEHLVQKLNVPVIAEGRVHTPEQAKKMLELGALAVVVGGAITRPLEIARRFVEGIG